MLPEANVRDQFPANVGQMLAVCAFNVLLCQFNTLKGICEGQHKIGIAHTHQQAVDDGDVYKRQGWA